ncbi:MAG: Na+/H+ antiporter NhaC family protein [Prevotella sp.]|nr:Na+/H+ antiporter NhaC family protein [Prevotella sp.]
MHKKAKTLKALSPIFVFLTLYLATSIIMQDFYKMPIIVAFLASAVYTILISPGALEKRIEQYCKGAGNNTMMLMILIFVLAGAFAASAKEMGAVDSTVNLTLRMLPPSLILPGIFIASCFISLSIGTSCGTIAALTPVAVGLASASGMSIPLMVGLVVGGTYFGDNLSFISDTTIIATQTQGCSMDDKFKVNVRIVLPVAIALLIIYYIIGTEMELTAPVGDFSSWKVLPYMAVIVLALMGLNVVIVLLIGLILTGIIGVCNGAFDVFGWCAAMNQGVMGMGELIIVTMLAGGMLGMIRKNGGIDYIIKGLTKGITSKRSAEFGIASLVFLVNVCTANNTVAIITAGPIAHDIAERFSIDPRRSASILDTASCFAQGILPYGAQVLIAAGLASISPVSIIPYLFYPFAIGIAIVLCILLRYPRKYS